MATLWAKTVTFQAVNVGDRLPIVIKWETRETIERWNARFGASVEEEAELCLDQAVVRSYVNELLEKAFPPESIAASGSSLEMDLLVPVLPDDTISLSGVVTAKRGEGSSGCIECEILIENDRREPVGRALAVVVL